MEDKRRQDDPRIVQLQKDVADNTALTKDIDKRTADIVQFWQSVEAGIRFLGWLGIIAKYVMRIGGAVTAVAAAWYAITHWGMPPK